MKKILICMFSCLLVLAGCGNNNEEKVSENTGKQQLVVAMDCASAPYSYLVDTQGDNTVAFGKSLYASGYDVLVARDLAKSLKKELVIKKMNADKFMDALDDGSVDMVMGGQLKDATNEDVMYSNSIYKTTLTMLVRSDSKFADKNELSQFKDAKVQGLSETYYDTAIDQIKGVKHQKGATSTTALIQAVIDKKIDAMMVNQQSGELIVKENSDLKLITLKAKKGFKDGDGIVITMDSDSELIDGVNKFIKTLKEDKQKEWMDLAISTSPKFLK